MSRGPGWVQRTLFHTIRRHGKPMTFGEIRAAFLRDFGAEPGMELTPSFERSLRRALHNLTSNGPLIAVGGGGRADPHRYFMDPIVIAMASKTAEEGLAWLEALEADPAGNKMEGLAEGWRQGMRKKKAPDAEVPVSENDNGAGAGQNSTSD
jgi:hypothetical protein